MRLACVLSILLAVFSRPAVPQESKPKAEPEAKPPVFVSPSARLAAAKNAFVTSAGGNEIPYNVIASGLEGWGRFMLVDSPAKADVIVEVTSPEAEGGVSVGSNTTRTGSGGRMEQSTSTSRNLSTDAVKLVVYDARTHVALWSASEKPKSAFRQKAREDNLVQAAERLMAKFRERLEPLTPKSN